MELLIVNRKGEKFTVLYDECDHDLVMQHKWSIGGGGYARATMRSKDGRQCTLLMHRVILGVSNPDILCDHKNRVRTDNRRENIRLCTPAQNATNKQARGRSAYFGVSLRVRNGRKYIQADIKDLGKSKFLGHFKTEEAAARAYDIAAVEIHGEFANLNFPNL